MKNKLKEAILIEAAGEMEQSDYLRRTERIDGPEFEGFTPSLQELIQLVKFHIQEFVECHWEALVRGAKISRAVEDAIWLRLDKIRRLLSEDDFKQTVEIACMQFGYERDYIIWKAFVYGDEALLRDAVLESEQMRRAKSHEISEELKKRIAEASHGQREEIPPEVLRRMAQPMRE